MIKNISIEEIVNIVKTTPEQWIFDWKRDIKLDSDDKKSEIIKDVVAIANATFNKPGFVFYGVDPNQKDPIVGITATLDDANLQQLFMNKVNPPVKFLYYSVNRVVDNRIVGVIHIPPSNSRPHIITVDYGKLRDGQILIRKGSSTCGIRFQDLVECFYGEESPYIESVLKKYGVLANQQLADVAYMKELREQEKSINRHFESVVGLPPGSLGD